MQTELLAPEQLLELVDAIWTSMLDLSVSPSNGGEYFVHEATSLTAGVQITGAWNGVVLLLPTEKFARRAASAMLGQPEAELDTVDVLDAVGELCNMIGGGIKSLLPGPSTLSLPSITQGTQYSVRLPKTRVVARFQFTCEKQPLEIRVLEACGFATE